MFSNVADVFAPIRGVMIVELRGNRAENIMFNLQSRVQQISAIVGEPLIYEAINKLLQMEKSKCLRKIERLQGDLSDYENRFGMNSHDAWKQYQSGALGDDIDVMEWMALVENLMALQEYYQRIVANEAA